jgi:hypothetical protein
MLVSQLLPYLTHFLYIKDLQTTARDMILSGPRKNCAEMRQLN